MYSKVHNLHYYHHILSAKMVSHSFAVNETTPPIRQFASMRLHPLVSQKATVYHASTTPVGLLALAVA